MSFIPLFFECRLVICIVMHMHGSSFIFPLQEYIRVFLQPIVFLSFLLIEWTKVISIPYPFIGLYLYHRLVRMKEKTSKIDSIFHSILTCLEGR